MKEFRIGVFVVFFFCWFSCADDERTSFDIGEAYYPLNQAHWTEYELDSIVFDDFTNTVDTNYYDMRLEVGEQIPDGEGGAVTRIYKYLKPRGIGNYTLSSVWFAKNEGGVVETIEENLRFIKLSLPPEEGKVWEGNQFIMPDSGENPVHSTDFYRDWEYLYSDVGVTETVNSLLFDDVIKVSETNRPGPPGDIHHYVASTWYSKDIGIIKKRWEMITENCGDTENDPLCQYKHLPVIERPFLRKGFVIEWRITGYSN